MVWAKIRVAHRVLFGHHSVKDGVAASEDGVAPELHDRDAMTGSTATPRDKASVPSVHFRVSCESCVPRYRRSNRAAAATRGDGHRSCGRSTIFQYASFFTTARRETRAGPPLGPGPARRSSSSRQQPGGDGAIPSHPMAVIAVVNVGNAGEARGEAFAYGALAHVARTPGLGAARHEELAVVGEETHDRVQVVRIERRQESLEGRCRHGSAGLHQSSSTSLYVLKRSGKAVRNRSPIASCPSMRLLPVSSQ